MSGGEDKWSTVLGVTGPIIVIVGVVQLLILCLTETLYRDWEPAQRIVLSLALLLSLSGFGIVVWVVKPFVDARESSLVAAQFMALHDPLTQLPNRRLIYDHIDKCLSSFSRHGQFGALIYFDLDGFKAINDAYGHKAGDAVLIAVARRLKEITRAEDVACRLGGDEFVVLTQNLGSDGQDCRKKIVTIATKISEGIRRPVDFDDLRLQVGCSIGVRILGADSANADLVLREADAAMYRAKKTRGGIVFSDHCVHDHDGIVPLGIDEIDREHRGIDALLDEAIHAAGARIDYVNRIAVTITEHFRDEHTICVRLGLNLTRAHDLEHQRIARLLAAIAARATEATAARDLAFIKDMITTHVVDFDRELLHARAEVPAAETT